MLCYLILLGGLWWLEEHGEQLGTPVHLQRVFALFISLLLPRQVLALLSACKPVPVLVFRNVITSATVDDIAALHKGITARLKGLWSL